MKRTSSVVLGTLAALFLATSASAQGLKERLVGSWMLISNEITPPNGTKQPFYGSGTNVTGMLVLDAGGRYALVQGRLGRPRFKSASRLQLEATPDELKAAILGFGANTGTWSVIETDKTLIRKYEIALIPNNDGADRKDAVTLNGDELRLVQTTDAGAKVEAVYRRSK
jgi:Lipocalin-like domain